MNLLKKILDILTRDLELSYQIQFTILTRKLNRIIFSRIKSNGGIFHE